MFLSELAALLSVPRVSQRSFHWVLSTDLRDWHLEWHVSLNLTFQGPEPVGV